MVYLRDLNYPTNKNIFFFNKAPGRFYNVWDPTNMALFRFGHNNNSGVFVQREFGADKGHFRIYFQNGKW